MLTASPTADLALTSPPVAGPAVLELQRRLTALGFAPGPADGVYGIATASAVRAFQRAQGLEVDGVVGPATRAALAAAMPPAHPQDSAVGARALAEARLHVGLRESPSGSNRTPFGLWFGIDGVPWCNIFVSYCFKFGAGYTLCRGFRGAGVYANGCTYVPTTEAWLRADGHWIGRTTPAPGDIAIYNWDRAGDPEHIGIVDSVLGGGRFTAIEGNTGVGNDSNGGQVLRRTRTLDLVDGFGRIAG